jgi:hypothetical protein
VPVVLAGWASPAEAVVTPQFARAALAAHYRGGTGFERPAGTTLRGE